MCRAVQGNCTWTSFLLYLELSLALKLGQGAALQASERGLIQWLLSAAAQHTDYAVHAGSMRTQLGMPALWSHIIKLLEGHALRWLAQQLPQMQRRLGDASRVSYAMPQESGSPAVALSPAEAMVRMQSSIDLWARQPPCCNGWTLRLHAHEPCIRHDTITSCKRIMTTGVSSLG